MELSAPVEAAIGRAVELVEAVLEDLLTIPERKDEA